MNLVNLGLVRRFFRDGCGLLAVLALATLATEVLFMAVLGEFSEQDHAVWMRLEFVQRMMKMLLGAELTPDISATGLISLGFTHPMIYALCWSYVLTAGTRMPASEIERGTADLVLTLPITRASVYVSVSLSVLAGAVILTAATFVGAWTGDRIAPMWEPLEMRKLAIVACNLLALNACVVAAALMVSCFSSRRGVAIAIVLGWLLASFLLEFLGQLSETARSMGVLGILHYYRSLPLVRSGDWPVRNIITLSALAIAMWTAGLLRFRARDIPAA